MANILDIQTVGGVLVARVDSDPSLGAGTDMPIGSFALANNGSGSFYKRSSSLNDWINTSNNALDGWQYDDLIVATATPVLVALTTAVANGGNNSVTPTNLDVPDINGVNSYTRYGIITSSIAATAPVQKAQFQQSTLNRIQISNTTIVGFGADVAFNGGQIDFSTDAVYQYVGFANAGTSAAPTQGVYVRPPYVGETSFYKCVLTYFDSGTSLPVNVIFDTTVPYDSTNNRFLSIFVLIDGVNDSVTYTIKYNGNTYIKTVNNVLATYPDMWSGSIINSFTINVSRISVSATPIARSIVIDKLYRYIKPNYEY